jgi:D-cysteine desulfhydrase family pyridoxal phosphate-dependent enzyme
MISALEAYRRLEFVHAPTPLEPLERLSRHYGRSLFVKRDDCTGLASGGNKARKLEYVLADALANDADTIITTGALQSNHARQTAAACARLGVRSILVLKETAIVRRDNRDRGGNLLLDRLLGAEIQVIAEDSNSDERMQQVADHERSRGHRPYVVPLGASTPLGALGYARCAAEIVAQMTALGRRATHVVIATASGGTQAGLVLGFTALGADIETLGVDVDANAPRTLQRVTSLVARGSELLGTAGAAICRYRVLDGHAGAAYGEPTAAGNAAIATMAQQEGIILDPVYTGKAMAGLIAMCEQGGFAEGDSIVFVHTGGLPIAFAYGGNATA